MSLDHPRAGTAPLTPRAELVGLQPLQNVLTAMEMERYWRYRAPPGERDPALRRKAVRKWPFPVHREPDYNQIQKITALGSCMYAIKQAMIASDHDKDLRVSIFHLDIRTPGKDFERFYDRAKQKGISFHRCRIHSVEPGDVPGEVCLRYITENGKQMTEEFELVVLSVGMEISPEAKLLAERTGIELTPEGFAATSCYTPVSTSRPGIFACGAFTGPKDIPLSVIEASAAATASAVRLSDVRYSLSHQKQFPPERKVSGETPRIGVFVCNCGSNIAEVVRVREVARYAETLPHVAFVETSLFACSQDSQELIRERIHEEN